MGPWNARVDVESVLSTARSYQNRVKERHCGRQQRLPCEQRGRQNEYREPHCYAGIGKSHKPLLLLRLPILSKSKALTPQEECLVLHVYRTPSRRFLKSIPFCFFYFANIPLRLAASLKTPPPFVSMILLVSLIFHFECKCEYTIMPRSGLLKKRYPDNRP